MLPTKKAITQRSTYFVNLRRRHRRRSPQTAASWTSQLESAPELPAHGLVRGW